MKKILTFILAFVMIASLSVSAFAIEGLPSYDGNYEAGPGANAGEINANKHAVIQNGAAGDPLKDPNESPLIVPGVQGNAIPKIDAKFEDGVEGYADIPFEDYIYIGANNHLYTGPEFDAWYNEVKNMDLIMKYCWDGNYIYFYLEYTVSEYVCTPQSAGDLWKWNCIQLGIAAPDAISDFERSETLYGYKIDNFKGTEASLSGSVAGTFNPIAEKDYVGKAVVGEGGATKVVHEFRTPIVEALGDKIAQPLKLGSVVRACIVIMNCNNGNSTGQKFISFGHGITGQESRKVPQHFINLTLGAGYDPNNIKDYKPYYTPTQAEKDVDYRDGVSFWFHQIKDTDDFADEFGTGTKTVATDENKFATFTTTAELARYTSAIYPTGLWGAGGDVGSTFAVVRYRTETENMKLGLNFINNGMQPAEGESDIKFIPEATIYPIEDTPIIADGEWHDAIFRLTDCTTFTGILVKTGIEISAGSIDIDGIKFFGWDPCPLYGIVDQDWCECEGECGEDCPCVINGVECDPDACECHCFDEDPGTDKPGTDKPGTDKPGTDKPGTDNPGTTDPTPQKKPAKKNGCKSSIAAGAAFVVVATIASGAVVLKKKED